MKKIGVALSLLILILPLYAQKKSYGSFFYEWNDCDVTISGHGEISSGFYRTGGLARHCIKNVIIEDGITAIGNDAFDSVYELVYVKFPNGLKTIGEKAFRFSGLSSIEFPNSVVSIEEGAFWGCKALSFANLPISLKKIGKRAFFGCDNILTVSIPEGVTSIGEYAFAYSNSISFISIPKSVTYIGDDAFSKCDAISSVEIPISFLEKGESEWRRIGLPIDVVRSYKNGLRDEKGNPLIFSDDIKQNGGYASVTELMDGKTKYYKVSKNGRYGLTDSNGREIIPCEMEALESAGTGYLKYKINGFWGLMNYTGKILIDTDRGYTSIGDFKTFNKRFPYTMAGYKGECDATGRQISKIKVESPKQAVATQTTTTPQKKEGEQKIIIEHKRDPVPVNVWVQCNICGGSGKCQTCGGTGIYTGWSGNKTLCEYGCGGSGKCSFCAGQGGHYEVQYK